MVEIIEVTTHSQMKKFANFPCELYSDCKYYVPSLYGNEVNMANPKKNFNAQYCDIKCFLAYKDRKIVGRIAGIIHNKANELYNKNRIRISRFDFIDDEEVSSKLLEAVENFGREKGMVTVHGPWGFNDTDREGLLTWGFDRRATYATNYNFPYYEKHLLNAGYFKESEWSEFLIRTEKKDKRIHKLASLLSKKFNLREAMDEMSFKKFVKTYRDEFFEVYNQCYRKLDNFVDIEGEEKKNVMSQFATIINPRYFSAILNEKDELVAFGIIIPSIAETLIKSRGHISLDLLKAIKEPKELECALIGVRPDYQKLGVSIMIIDRIFDNVLESGIKEIETNPMLTTNSDIRAQFSHFDYSEIKKRCTYIKSL